MFRFTTLFSIICALLVNTRFESLRKVCVKFLDASANAGLLSVLSNASLLISVEVVLGICCCGSCFGLRMTLDVESGL